MQRRGRTPDSHGLAWALAAFAAAVLPHLPVLPPWAPAVALLIGSWRWLAERRRWRLPSRWLVFPVAFAGFGAVLVGFRTLNGLEAGTSLLVVMAAVKLLETRRRRDQWVLVLIACFLMLAAFLRSQSLWTAAYAVAALWCIATAWLVIGYQTGEAAHLPWRRAMRLSARYAAQAAPLALLMFVLFPRLPGAFWALPASSAVTGLGETMSPGDISELSLSDEVAFRARFDGRLPTPAERYWRGPVLHEFDGRSWSLGAAPLRSAAADAIDYRGEPLRYRLTLEPHQRRYLLALDMPRASALRAELRFDYQLVGDEPVKQLSSFEVESHPDYVAGLRLPPQLRGLDVALPSERNPRTLALGRELRVRAAHEIDYIEHVLALFREQGFSYTLEPPRAGYDAVDDFMFETRRGFCGHFASAFTVLMRTAGIPARVVTGYQGGEYNTIGDYLIVRHSDAHAWSEVWLAGRGWIRIDPTAAVAPERIERGSRSLAAGAQSTAGAGRALLERARFAWDAFEQLWNDWVIQYGPRTQQALLRDIGLPDADWRHLTALLAGAMIAASLALAGLLALEFRPRRRDEAQALYLRFCRKLAAQRLARRPHETPSSHLARVSSERPALAPAAHAIVRLYLRLRYEPDAGEEELSRLRHLINRFGAAR